MGYAATAFGNAFKALSIVLALGAVAACSSMSDMLDGGSSTSSTSSTTVAAASSDGAVAPNMAAADKSEPVANLYNKGLESMKSGSYKTAAKEFAEVERQHPYSKLATKAILMQAYAQYQRNAYDEAINAANRFITLHPGHRDAPYAYYLIALSYYEQIGDVKRDQTATKKALESLEEVTRRYPDTPYAADAAAKAVLARDHLAGKEMEVGRYYLKRGSYLAAVNRFKTVVIAYQTTTQTPEALYRLTESYMALGVRSEAQTAAAVLGYNYPNSEWYKDAYALLQNDGLTPSENKESWISRAWNAANPL
ncbi:MAG: outer membrane protein assembly factor BamD [Rhizobiales bacterium]|nr:outer membrane protein assembly factor BamD [Hyphomicrobiales bacterium]